MSTKLRYSDIVIPTDIDFEVIVPIATVKQHLRVEFDDDDDLIAIYRDTACLTAMHETNRMIGVGSYEYRISRFPEVALS